MLKCENVTRFFPLNSYLLILFTVGSEKYELKSEKKKISIYFIPEEIDFYFIPTFSLTRSQQTWWRRLGEEKQFVTVYHSEKMAYVLHSFTHSQKRYYGEWICGMGKRVRMPYECMWCGIAYIKRQQKDWGNTRLLILHEIDSKLYNRHCPNLLPSEMRRKTPRFFLSSACVIFL